MQSLKQHQERLNLAKLEFSSWQKYAESIGVKNGATVWDYVKKGIVPASKSDRKKMGIYKMSAGGSVYRRRNPFAKEKGWKNLSEFLNAVEKGDAEIPYKK